MNFEDLDRHFFEHGGGLSELRSLLEPTKLVHGHSEVGARRWLDLMPVDLNELLVEVTGDVVASLLVSVSATGGCAAPSVCGDHGGICFQATPSTVGIPSRMAC
jgi:hypothetical protein